MRRVSWRWGVAAALASVLVLAGGAGLALAHDDDDHGSGRGWLGVFLGQARDGVRIMSVMSDSPAAEAGIEAGDVVVEIDGRRVEDTEEFMEAFRGLEPGDRPSLTVEGDGDRMTFEPVLEENSNRFMFKAPRFNFRFGGDHHGGDHFESGTRGYLGVHLQGLTDELREYFGAPENEGILVSRVEEDSPAERAGLRVGDVITAIDGESVETHGDLIAGLQGLEEGDVVEIQTVRDGRPDAFQVSVDIKETNSFMWRFECDDDDGEECPHMQFLPEGSLDGVFRHFGDSDMRRNLEERLRELEERMERLRPEENTGSRT